MAKYLLVTSDDFGMCHAVNAGIARAMTEGIVRSTNFLVPCPWFSEASELARAHGLAVGVHLCLTCDWDRLKWGPLTRAPSLSDEHGHFRPTYAALAQTALDDEIYAELEAQIALVERLGHEPTHLDSHMLISGDDRPIARRVKAIIRRLCEAHGLVYTYDTVEGRGLRHFRDELCSSPLSAAEVWAKLESWTDDGVYHWISHPAEPSAELFALCTEQHPARPWAAEYRVRDLELLTAPETRERVEALGFEIVDVPRLLELRGRG